MTDKSPEGLTTKVYIEPARPDDAAAICDVRDRAWLEAYPSKAHGITREDILLNAQGPDGVFVPRRITYWKEQFTHGREGALGTIVARQDGKVVGYADPQVDERGRRRIGAMYVVPESQGLGIGRQLMQQALEALGRDQDIYLEVVAYNQNAINFYQHFGFVMTGNPVPEDPDRPDYLKTLPQVEMMLPAAAI